MKSLIAILFVGFVSFIFSDIKSSGFMDGFLFPLIFGASVLSLFVWLVARLMPTKGVKNRTKGDSGGGYVMFGDGGGDGGGDCGGGGGCD